MIVPGRVGVGGDCDAFPVETGGIVAGMSRVGASLSPAWEIAAVADATGWPVRSGITIPSGVPRPASAMSRLMLGCSMPSASGAGFCAMTLPGVAPGHGIWATLRRSNPARRMSMVAAQGLAPLPLKPPGW